MGEKVFISYSRTDGAFVLELARDLRAAGVDLWVDQLDIRTGDTWDQAVENALEECAGLLVVLSPDAVASRSVMDEVSYALEEDKRVIPVIHRECKIPFRLRRVQHTDLTVGYDRGLSGLVRLLRAAPDPLAADAVPATPASFHGGVGGAPLLVRDDRPWETVVPPVAWPDAETFAPGVVSLPPPPPPSWKSRHPRLSAAVSVGAAGAVVSGVAVAIVAADENLSLIAVVGWGVGLGLAWAAAGAIAGGRPRTLATAVATSLLASAGWVVIGTGVFGRSVAYAVDEAVGLAFPGGGLLGALIGAWMARVGEARKRRKQAAA